MKKKLLSILLAGILLTGLTLNAESFAGPRDHHGQKYSQHKEMRQNLTKKDQINITKISKKLMTKRNLLTTKATQDLNTKKTTKNFIKQKK